MNDVTAGETRFHEASDADTLALWPAVRAARLFDHLEAFEAWRRTRRWAVRVDDSGAALLAQLWRDHLDIAHLRAVWCPPADIPALLADVRRVAGAHGLNALLSPLLDERSIEPYAAAGLSERAVLVPFVCKPSKVRACGEAAPAALRHAEEGDAQALANLEQVCFTDFWRHGEREIGEHMRDGRMMVAEEAGEVIGYTLSTLKRSSATLARIAVRPDARRRGIGGALLSDAALWATEAGAFTLSLCTQETNHASRALYRSFGLAELPDRLILAADPGVSF